MTENSVAEILAHPIGEVRMVPIDSVKPYAKNPRKIPEKAVDQVAASIREFGWQQPVVVDGDMIIIIGHVRHRAAKHLGLTEVPVLIECRLSEQQVKALRIADNRTHSYATWDYPMLLDELTGLDSYESLDLADWNAIITGFEESQEAAMLELDDETTQLITDNYTLVCTFDTKENAELAAPSIMNLEGAVNVRYSGSK